jgi:hypothetical protein
VAAIINALEVPGNAMAAVNAANTSGLDKRIFILPFERTVGGNYLPARSVT